MAVRLDNRPLLGTIDRDLFVPPSIMPALTAAVDRNLNVLILGGPGSGKTTLLRAVETDRREDDLPGSPPLVNAPPRGTEWGLSCVGYDYSRDGGHRGRREI